MSTFDLFFLILAMGTGFYMACNIGANDVANAIGTSVGSGALKLRRAVLLAAIFEFTGAYFFGSDVAETMSHGIIRIELFQGCPMELATGMVAALGATGLWLQLASYYGWPVSTTHSIVGAIAGFGLYSFGWGALLSDTLVQIALSWLISPVVGGLISYCVFSYLRRAIFFKADPFAALQRIAPLIISIFATLMSGLLLFNLHSSEQLALLAGEIALLLLSLAVMSYCLAYGFKERLLGPALAPPRDKKADLAAQKIEAAIASMVQLRSQVAPNLHLQLDARVAQLQLMLGQLPACPLQAQQVDKIENFFAWLQCFSACFMALSHGANDVSNAVGPLSVAVSILYSKELPSAAPIPTWLLALGGGGIVLGLAIWGWRVIETVGKKITQLTPSRGVSAELGCATTVLVCSQLGLPVSTTHVLVGSILGVGLARGIGALNLATLRDIALSWIVTLPMGALLSMALAAAIGHLL